MTERTAHKDACTDVAKGVAMSGDGALEIIRGIERRRRWSLADKLRVVAEVEAPGAVFAAVARRHDISRGQLWNWRRQFRCGEIGEAASRVPQFLPVCMAPEQVCGPAMETSAAERSPRASKSDRTASGRMEITFTNGVSIRVEGTVDAALLKVAISAARG